MSVAVVWIDREHSKLFFLSEDRMQRETVLSSKPDHPTHRLEGDELRDPKFLHDVALMLRNVDRILILGPGLAKVHLHHHLKQHDPAIARKVVGCETVDHPTDNQIAAYAMQYFRAKTGT